MADSSLTDQIPMVFRSQRGKNLQLVGQRDASAPSQTTDSILIRERALASKERELQEVITVLKVAHASLGQRMLTIISLCGAVGMFVYASLMPDVMRITAACLYAALVFAPLAWLDARSRE